MKEKLQETTARNYDRNQAVAFVKAELDEFGIWWHKFLRLKGFVPEEIHTESETIAKQLIADFPTLESMAEFLKSTVSEDETMQGEKKIMYYIGEEGEYTIELNARPGAHNIFIFCYDKSESQRGK